MRFLQLSDVTKGLIYVHDQGMIHGDLKGVRLASTELDPCLQRRWTFRVTFWSTKLAMPASRISGLRFSLAQLFRICASGVAPPDG